MLDPRPFSTLGHADHGWLDARHHFSFAGYHDPKRMGWGTIRVWNDDEIAPHSGFDPHPHRDMEIITYVRRGAITHLDNMGNEGRTEAGDVQVMTAGRGVVHAEYNREDEPTLLYQIWIETAAPGADPGWAAAKFPKADRAGDFVTLASGDPDDLRGGGVLPIRADAQVLGATLKAGDTISYEMRPRRHVYLALADGSAEVNGVRLAPRDGLAARDEPILAITAQSDAEIVLVDAP